LYTVDVTKMIILNVSMIINKNKELAGIINKEFAATKINMSQLLSTTIDE